jgi:hypothetical protein
MNNRLKYLKLWQKKRNQLPISDNAHMDWLQMQSLLDQQMPVGNNPFKENGGKGGWGIMGSKMSAIFIGVATTAVVGYFVVSKTIHRTRPELRLKSVKVNMLARRLPDSEYRADNYGNPSQISLDSLYKEQSNQQNSNTLASATVNAASHEVAPLSQKCVPNTMDSLADIGRSATSNTSVGTSYKAKLNKTNPNGHHIELASALSASKSVKGGGFFTVSRHSVATNKLVNRKGTGRIGSRRAGTSMVYSVNNFKSPYKKPNNILVPLGNRISRKPDFNRSKLRLGSRTRYRLYRGRHFHQLAYTIRGRTTGKGIKPALVPLTSQTNRGGELNSIPPAIVSTAPTMAMADFSLSASTLSDKIARNSNSRSTKSKASKSSDAKSRVEWGILLGVNTSSSSTPKNQNTNWYGKWPVDAYVGGFATINIYRNIAFNIELRMLNPQVFSGSYNIANTSKVDTLQKTLPVTDSRKIYYADVPLHFVYKVNDHFRLKFGPVVSLPVKQITIGTGIRPDSLKRDSAFYQKTAQAIGKTTFIRKINYGLSGGLNLNYGRIILEANYYKSFKSLNIYSPVGNYQAPAYSQFQFTLGLLLGKNSGK